VDQIFDRDQTLSLTAGRRQPRQGPIDVLREGTAEPHVGFIVIANDCVRKFVAAMDIPLI
jgi:hypothetical protein